MEIITAIAISLLSSVMAPHPADQGVEKPHQQATVEVVSIKK